MGEKPTSCRGGVTRYAAETLAENFAIQSSVIANLETPEATIGASRHSANCPSRPPQPNHSCAT